MSYDELKNNNITLFHLCTYTFYCFNTFLYKIKSFIYFNQSIFVKNYNKLKLNVFCISPGSTFIFNLTLLMVIIKIVFYYTFLNFNIYSFHVKFELTV